MTFIVVYDSSVLYGAVGDLLVRLADRPILTGPTFAGPAFQARWAQAIADECVEELKRRRPDLDEELLRHRLAKISDGVDFVTGYEYLIPAMSLPNPRRDHVLAAAIRCSAQAIVTRHPDDFPAWALQRYGGLEALDADVFVVNQIEGVRDAGVM